MINKRESPNTQGIGVKAESREKITKSEEIVRILMYVVFVKCATITFHLYKTV
jgi:hypothetical protein